MGRTGHRQRGKGKSNLKPIRDGVRFLNIIIRIVLLFHPARFFMPLSFLIIFLGIVGGILQLVYTGHLGNVSMLVIQTGVFTLFFGFLAEQISLLRRN